MSTASEAPVPAPIEKRSRLAWVEALLRRFPWAIPAASFATGWVGFAMVKRGESFARSIALLAFAGWLWLLVEPLLRRFLERRKEGIGKFVANFFSQSMQQEMLFFCLPLIIGATQKDLGQIAFAVLVMGSALLSTLDPVYERYIAARAATRLMFHAYCSLITAIVVLPMVVHLPLERTLPLAIIGVNVWLFLTLPMSLKSLSTWRVKLVWVAIVLVTPLLLWLSREHVPAAGVVVTQGVVTQQIADLTPGAPITRLTSKDLSNGVVAFVAIRAPMGVAQSVIFEWRHGDESERIVAEIHGGNNSGWRTFARKQAFPANSKGKWTIDILTPQRQLLKRLSFVVD